jgi:hypothetical protein
MLSIRKARSTGGFFRVEYLSETASIGVRDTPIEGKTG